jgi:hypothetical protein
MAILTTPERSLKSPAYEPNAMGVAVAKARFKVLAEKRMSKISMLSAPPAR